MKKLLLLFAVLMTAITAKAEDFILYTTSDGQALNVDYFNEFDTFGAHIVSHTYEDGQGKIQFDGDVQGIGNEAFSYCSTLTSIEIPNSVKTIGFLAFNQCTSLQSVVIPNSVHHIRPAAFGYCTSLKSVVLPNCLVEQGGFAYCPSLEYISGPFASNDNRCLIIGGILIAFAPAGLTSYEIPNSVQIIGDGAFVNCTELTSVVIPESVQEIVGYGFIGCYNLSSISGKFASDDNRCLIVDGTLISFAPAGLTEYIIPNSVTKIGEFAFKDSRELSSLVIPSSVTEIGKDAFNFCSGLQEITSLNPIPPSISIYTLI